jgi:hypothetical protein
MVDSMMEDEFSGERSVIPDAPSAADYEPAVRLFRSVAALALVFGTAGIMLLPFGLLRFHQGAIPGDFEVSLFDEPGHSISPEGLWLFCSSLLGTGLAASLFVGAVGGVRLKSWALHTLRLWAIASILLGVGGSYFYSRWLLPPWRDHLAQVRGVIDSLGSLAGWIIGSFLALAMLLVVNRSRVRAALHRDGKLLSQS